jgi:hypothetical protein
MKVEKMLIIALVASSLLIASISTVGAVDETRTITDAEDDVVDISGETYDYPNIDITEIKYEREGTNVTIAMTVKGNIENIGDIYGEDWDNIVTYMFILTTSFDMYTIMYVNNYCVLSTSYEEKNITDYSVEDSVLEVNFNINNTDETYDSLAVDSVYFSFLSEEDMIMAQDTAGDLPLMVNAFTTSPGETGVEIEFIGYVDYGQSPYEYLWDFGDDKTSNERSPTHTYTTAGAYEYTFTVTDSSGASESYSDEIEILGDDEDNDTPGFELIIAITAIGFLFLWKRKR